MLQPVGIRALAVSLPTLVRTNDYWQQHYPQLVQAAAQKSLARAFSPVESPADSHELDLWTQEMIPYLSDPFRGTVERRVLGPDESLLMLENRAASDALNAAKLSPDQVDLMLVASLFPEQLAPGNAALLAGQLGLGGAAWNLESTCTSALVALQTATALVRSGEYHNVLVVVSTAFSRFTDENDTLSFLTGDGAGAFVVGALEAHQGILSTKMLHTASTCGAFFNELTVDAVGNPRLLIRAGKSANQMFRDQFVQFCRTCCDAAVAAAGVTLAQIDFFVFNTNTAWYASVYAQALGISPERTLNLNHRYANIGAASPIVNLYHAVQAGKIRKNDLVLLYTFGATGNAGAIVMRWGDVAIAHSSAQR